MIKSRDNSKYYIEQYIINKYSKDDFEQFVKDTEETRKNNAIVGYHFMVKEPAYVLNLYLIDREHYRGPQIFLSVLKLDWESFFVNKQPVFINPPIELWLNTKMNWCKKLANRLSKQYNKSYEECLSEVYLAVMKCYSKNTVYMGNLLYIEKAAHSNMLTNCRKEKREVETVSLETIVTTSSDGEQLTIADMVADENEQNTIDYKLLLDKVIKVLSKSFSEREIETLLKFQGYELPRNLYRRLLKWRQIHKSEDFVNEE